MTAFQSILAKLSAHGSMVTMRAAGKAALAQCPAHDDRHQSLSVDQNHKGDALLKCHAGCATPDVVAALGLTMAALFSDGVSQTAEQQREIYYDYKDEDGNLLFQVVRTVPKGFRQRRPNKDREGPAGYGWIWNLEGVRRVMYRLDEMQGKRAALLVEGEKDADNLWKLKIPATTTPMGAANWKPEFADQLSEAGCRRLGILPDNDEPGRKYALNVAKDCHEAGIDVSIINLPGLGPKEDVSDFLARAAHPRGDLIRAIQGNIEFPSVPLGDDAPLAAALEGAQLWQPGQQPQRRRAARLRRVNDLSDKPIEYLIKDLIPLGWFGEIAGRDGRGKSLLAMNIAKSVLTGEPLFNTFEVGKTGPVVAYLLDDPENLVRERFTQLGLAGHPDLHVGTEADLDKDDPNLWPDLAALCLEVKPVLVIVDALYLFTPANRKNNETDQANSSGAMAPIMAHFDKICSQTGATVALVAHDNKAGSDVAGSQVVRNMAKWILRMALPRQYEKDKQGGRTTNDRVLELDKLKTGQSKVWGLKITTADHGGAEFTVVPISEVEKSKRGKSVEELAERRKEIVSWLRFLLEPGPRTSNEVSDAAKEAGFKQREIQGGDVADAAGVEKVHPDPTGPWLWRLKP